MSKEYFLATFMAHSLASAPELAKKTFFRLKFHAQSVYGYTRAEIDIFLSVFVVKKTSFARNEMYFLSAVG